MDGFNLGKATAYIQIDASGVKAGINAALSGLDAGSKGIGSAFQKVGDMLTGFGARLTVLTAPLKNFQDEGIKVATSFESVMKNIEVFGGVSSDELEQVRAFVLKMGQDTVFSAQDAGDAMLDLLKSGMDLKEAMATLPTVLQLATVGDLKLAAASDIVTSAMAQFKLKAADAPRIVDALARAANASKADVSDLGQALGNVGPIANKFGLSIEQTSAVLAIFANNGIEGAEAGTQLKSLLLNMSNPTDKVEAAFKKLGTSLYDVNGNVRPLSKVLAEMKIALAKLPLAQQNELLHDLAGSYGVTGLNALLASDGIDAMLQKMQDAPSAAKIADEQTKTFGRSLEGLKGSIETLMINAFTPFIQNVLKPLVDKYLIPIINTISKWAEENPELAGTIAAIVAVLVALGPILAGIGVVISTLAPAFAAIGTVIGIVGGALGLIVSPIGLIIAGIAAIVAAFATDFMGIRTTVERLAFIIGRILGDLFGEGGTVSQLLFILKTMWDQFFGEGGTLSKIILAAAGFFASIFGKYGAIALAWDAVFGPEGLLKQVWDNLFGEGKPLHGLLKGIQNFFDGIFGEKGFIKTEIWDKVWGKDGLIQMVWNSLFGEKGTLRDPMDKFKGFVDTVISAIKGIIEGVIGTVQSVINKINEAIDAAMSLLGINQPLPKIPGSGGTTKQIFQNGQQIGNAQQMSDGSWRYYWNNGNSMNGVLPPGAELRDKGGDGLPGQAYMINPVAGPEAFIPQTAGTFIPNFDKWLAGIAANVQGGGQKLVFEAGSIVINASTEAGGRAAAGGLMDELDKRMASRGILK